ncbi:AN1-type zinc finger protein 6 isoform X2 [Myripristis murdjan]|uniref:AN1-type zinc finger protein 6 isoform X2 n=1 Tax=Myripristis murdjan TaxID=586833 RepID=UPI001175CBBF|nr:AN1-type zinc finger protein 6 isoform X2 [Myripristis murdjan]
MAQETNQSQAPLLCTTGCGFYGSPRNNGMCSVCYKDFLQRQNSNGRISPPGSSSTDSSIGESFLAQCSDTATVPVSTAITHTDTSGHSSGVTTASATSPTEESASGVKASLKADDLQTVSEDSAQTSTEITEKPKTKKNRCFTCRKKIGLTGFDCRCGNVFCSMHRYSDTHNCSFDYKADAAEKIRKENPVIVGEKIQKI